MGDLQKCSRFIEEVREVRYNKVKERQLRKFHNLLNKNNRIEQNNRPTNNRIGQASKAISIDGNINNNSGNNNNNNPTSVNNKWVINLSSSNLTQAQM